MNNARVNNVAFREVKCVFLADALCMRYVNAMIGSIVTQWFVFVLILYICFGILLEMCASAIDINSR